MALTDKVIAWEEWGAGSGHVYLYYYPSQKAHARMSGQPIWECKIGCTKESDVHAYVNRTKVAKDRVIFDLSADETPDIPLILKTDTPKQLERQIHDILKTFDRWHKIPGANEWYLTSPDEVIGIYQFIQEMDVFR